MVASLGELSIFCALLLLFMYIFALLGMQFFAMRAYTDLDDVIVPAEEILERMQAGEILNPIRVSFNNIYLSLTTVFCVIFAEDWNWDMYYNVVTFGVKLHYYATFFIIVFAFGNYVLFALFAAILLSQFDAPPEEEKEFEDSEDEAPVKSKYDEPKKSLFRRIFSKETAYAIKDTFIDFFGKRLRKKPEPEEVLDGIEDEAGFDDSNPEESDPKEVIETEQPLNEV